MAALTRLGNIDSIAVVFINDKILVDSICCFTVFGMNELGLMSREFIVTIYKMKMDINIVILNKVMELLQ